MKQSTLSSVNKNEPLSCHWSVGIQLLFFPFSAPLVSSKCEKRNRLSPSSPSCDAQSNLSNSNMNSATKYYQLLDFIIHSTIKIRSHQFLLLASPVHTHLFRKYIFSSSQVTAHCFWSAARVSFFSIFPIRGIFHRCLITDTIGGC